ncbi:MAG: 7-carboxy-7-deazaguanine synthase QueE [Phycisphaerales bacterium]|nr:7-carboxy-7-deazaguanine synthase QueE [Phycisphaerales bacterium]
MSDLLITESFLSIQGEGKLTGIPSYFIRAGGCNLRCAWCDTPYASWNPEGVRVSVDHLVAQAAASGARHAVLTGGEPMIFDAVTPLAAALRERGMHITLETAGTVYRDLPCDLMSISPKLASSTPREGDPRDPGGVWRLRHEARRIDPDTIARLIRTYPYRQLKFVVTGPHDLPEIDALLTRLPAVDPGDVLLMPEGVTPPAPRFRQWLAGECIRRGWRYCPRLHIDLFGNRRGT